MLGVILIGFGGALGSIARYGSSRAAAYLLGSNFPYGTLLVNIIGSFSIGVAIAYFLAQAPNNAHLKLFCITGFLGGFTTFSAFSLDAVELIERGALLPAALYIGLSVSLAIIGTFLGLAFARSLF